MQGWITPNLPDLGYCDDPQNVIFWLFLMLYMLLIRTLVRISHILDHVWTSGACQGPMNILMTLIILFSKIILESLSQENSELTTPVTTC